MPGRGVESGEHNDFGQQEKYADALHVSDPLVIDCSIVPHIARVH
jgi:hypothetical protein